MVVSKFRKLLTGTHIGSLASTIYPGLDERLWNRRRDREMREEVHTAGYKSLIADLQACASDRPSHLIVVPPEGPGHESWRAGTRNFYYEAAQSAREKFGVEKVTVFAVDSNEHAENWHVRLIKLAHEIGATHIITHIESDPSSNNLAWTWDVLWSELAPRWDGCLMGVMFDSSFTWITNKSRRLAIMSPNFLVVDICMPMDNSMVSGRSEVGPVNMPVSRESLQLIDDRIEGLPKLYDVSLIGALYPDRVEALDRLRASGLRVAVNPHRNDETRNLQDSRDNQPSYLDYMAGLAQSEMTINFSRSSAGPFEQMKTRVIEAALAGTLLLTDDQDRTRLFFKTDEEYAYFNSPPDLPEVVQTLMKDPVKLGRMQLQAQQRAREVADTSFWGGIEAGLRKRGLPVLCPGELPG